MATPQKVCGKPHFGPANAGPGVVFCRGSAPAPRFAMVILHANKNLHLCSRKNINYYIDISQILYICFSA